MEPTVAFAPKIHSGIDVIDQRWGGLYRGGSYLLYGRAASGRGLLTLLFAQTATRFEESCLFIAPDRPKDLIIQAASIGFNLREAYASKQVRMVRIPPLINIRQHGDDAVARVLHDLIALIRRDRPQRLIINDFTPFLGFQSFERLRAEFIHLLEQIDSLDTTTMLVMPEPANIQSQRVIDFMRSEMTGAMYIQMAETEGHSTQRIVQLQPNIGHIERAHEVVWDLQSILREQTAEGPGERTLRKQAQPPSLPPRKPQTSSQVDPAAFDPTAFDPTAFAPPTPPSAPPPMPSQASQPLAPQSPAPQSSAPQPSASQHPAIQPRATQPQAPQQPPMSQPPRHEAPEASKPAASASSSHMSEGDQIAPIPAPPPNLMEMEMPTVPVQRLPRPGSDANAPAAPKAPGMGEQPSLMPDLMPPPPPAMPMPPVDPPVELSATPSKSMTVPPPMPEQDALSYENRAAFTQRLQQHFDERAASGQPFLLLAMRMDRSGDRSARPFDFEFILDLVTETLRKDDDLMTDMENERLIVLLADSRPEDATAFFKRLKTRLREEAPQQADHLLHAVSAIVVENGSPFPNADAFLTYALEET